MKWLRCEQGAKEFSVGSRNARVRFVNRTEGSERKRYAIVGEPSKRLIDMLEEAKVDFTTHYKPDSKAPTNDEEESDEPNSEDEREALLIDEVGNVNLSLSKDVRARSVLIQECDVHALVNILMSIWSPPAVQIISSFPFQYSTNKISEINSSGKVLSTAFEKPDPAQNPKPAVEEWNCIELTGVYTFTSFTRIIKCVESHLKSQKDKQEVKFYIKCKTGQSSVSLNWPFQNST